MAMHVLFLYDDCIIYFVFLLTVLYRNEKYMSVINMWTVRS